MGNITWFTKQVNLFLYLEGKVITSKLLAANNRINSDWQFRCAPLPAGYAERYGAGGDNGWATSNATT